MARSSATSVALPPSPSGDGVAQRAGEPFEDRGLEQEVADVGGLAGEHLLGEVVDDVAVVAGETGDERAGVLAALHRQRGQLQRGDPAFGACLERGDVALAQPQTHRAVEVGRGLLGGEAQVGGADLDQLTACPQLGQRQRRVGPGGEDDVQLRRLVLEQEASSRRAPRAPRRGGSRRGPAAGRSAVRRGR